MARAVPRRAAHVAFLSYCLAVVCVGCCSAGACVVAWWGKTRCLAMAPGCFAAHAAAAGPSTPHSSPLSLLVIAFLHLFIDITGCVLTSSGGAMAEKCPCPRPPEWHAQRRKANAINGIYVFLCHAFPALSSLHHHHHHHHSVKNSLFVFFVCERCCSPVVHAIVSQTTRWRCGPATWICSLRWPRSCTTTCWR